MDIYVNYNVIGWNTNLFSEIFLISLILNQLIAYGGYKGNIFINSYNNDANLQNIGLIVSVMLVAILGILAFIYLIFTKDKYKENYKLLEKILEEYGEKLISMLDTYNKAIFYMLTLDVDASRKPVKTLYKVYKEKRNNGEFSLQI